MAAKHSPQRQMLSISESNIQKGEFNELDAHEDGKNDGRKDLK